MKISNAMRLMCPMVADRGSNDDNRCVAAGCMAWRWHNNESGYCGLAGAPKNTAGSGIVRPADIEDTDLKMVSGFLEKFCDLHDLFEVEASRLWKCFEANHGTCMSKKRFGQIVGTKFERVKRGGMIYYMGLELA